MGVKDFIKINSPSLKTGAGIALFLGSVIFGVNGTVKAVKACDERKKELGVEKLSPLEVVKVSGKHYIATGATFLAASWFTTTSIAESMKQTSVMATAYGLSEATLKLTEKKMDEVLGEKKSNEVKDAVAKEQMLQTPITNVTNTGAGDILVLDPLSGRYFYSSIAKIQEVENQVVKALYNYMYVTLNEFYDALGLPRVDDAVGQELGWSVDNGFELRYSYQAAPDGRPCLVLGFQVGPKYDYRDPY